MGAVRVWLQPNRGQAWIISLPSEHDRIDVSAYHFADWAALQAAMTTVDADENGIPDTQITLDGAGNTVVLLNVAAATLTSADFII